MSGIRSVGVYAFEYMIKQQKQQQQQQLALLVVVGNSGVGGGGSGGVGGATAVVWVCNAWLIRLKQRVESTGGCPVPAPTP